MGSVLRSKGGGNRSQPRHGSCVRRFPEEGTASPGATSKAPRGEQRLRPLQSNTMPPFRVRITAPNTARAPGALRGSAVRGRPVASHAARGPRRAMQPLFISHSVPSPPPSSLASHHDIYHEFTSAPEPGLPVGLLLHTIAFVSLYGIKGHLFVFVFIFLSVVVSSSC